MLCRDLEMVTIERCGHWTQQERPDELNRLLVDWLRRKVAPATR
jgi:pimeloyl-ACP methyl ester carboxylesterase